MFCEPLTWNQQVENTRATFVFHIRGGLARLWSFASTPSDEHDSALFRGHASAGKPQDGAKPPTSDRGCRSSASSFRTVDTVSRTRDFDGRGLDILDVRGKSTDRHNAG